MLLPIDALLLTAIKSLDMDGNYLIEINQNNSDIVEDLIKNDPDYHFANSERDFLNVWKKKAGVLSTEEWFNVVKGIATENSTRTSNKDMKLVAAYISDPDKKFMERLESGDWNLVDDLYKAVKDAEGKGIGSLASKICKYISEWLHPGADHYSINDSIVRAVLPYYLKKYKVSPGTNNLEKLTYVEFMSLIEQLEVEVRKACKKLNKNLIDHILWYSYKGDPIRREVAIALGK